MKSLRALGLAGLGFLPGSLASCAREAEVPRALVRLLELEAVTLNEAPPPPPSEPVFAHDFSPGGPWRALPTPGGERAPDVTHGSEEGRGFMRLSGPPGALQVRVAVEPGQLYTLRGELRARALAEQQRPLRVGTFWLGEAADERPFEELVADPKGGFERLRDVLELVPDGRWQRREFSFESGPDTHFVHLLCVLSREPSDASSEVDFRALALERESPAGYARAALAAAQAKRASSETPTGAWRQARQLGSELGGEFRPGLVLLPGDRLTFALPPLEGTWSLRLGLGPWLPGRLAGRALASTLTLESGARRAQQTITLAAEEKGAGRWTSCVLELEPGARTLALSLEGSGPLALGSPELVRAGLARPAGPNVLLVSLDTLRADHLGLRTGGAPLTPTLDRLAQAGLFVEDASAASPYTLPSHTTMLTGQHPSVHGVVGHESRLAALRSETLAERLAAAGYVTRASTAGGFVNPEFGLDRGFDAFTTVDPLRAEGSHYARTLASRLGVQEARHQLAAHGFEGVKNFLAQHVDQRFFLFLHTYTVHDYDAPEAFLPCRDLGCGRPSVPLRTRTAAEAAAFTPEMRQHVRHLYLAALRYTDARLGELLAELERLGLAANTLVLVTSDHGEEFFEHGHLQHGMTLHEEILRVPMLLAGPGIEPRRLKRAAMLCDVAPTLLARLGLAPLRSSQGVDLLGPAWPERPIWAEVDDRFVHQYALRSEDGAKTLHAPAEQARMYPRPKVWEHYDLGRDPGELEDLWAGDGLGPRGALLTRERARLEELGAALGAAGQGELDAATTDELSGLGYGD